MKAVTKRKTKSSILIIIPIIAAMVLVIGFNYRRISNLWYKSRCRSEYKTTKLKKTLFNTTIRVTSFGFDGNRILPNNRLEIYFLNPDQTISEDPIVCPITDENGVAQFKLPKGIYQAEAAGSFTGSTSFSVEGDMGTSLRVMRILN